MNDTTLQEIAQTFLPEYREFVESSYAETLALQLGAKYDIEGYQVILVKNGFLLYLHFVLLNSELTNFLVEEVGLDRVIAEKISADYLADLPKVLAEQHDEMVVELRKPPTPTPTPTTNSVSPVRTMENDMATAQEGQTYTSSQDALLKNKVGEVPKPNIPQT